MINAYTIMNNFITKNANLLLFSKKFAKRFAGYAYASIVNMFSEYDQFESTKKIET